MTQETAPGSQPIPADAPLTFRAGHALIELHRGVDCFSVLTMQGTRRVDEWSCTYPTEEQARAEARRAAKAFRWFKTDTAIAAEYNRLADAIEARRRRRANAADLRDQLAAVQPLQAAARDADLAARILGTIRAAQAVQPLPQAQRTRTWADLRAEFAATHPSN